MSSTPITGALVVCVAAAGVAAGALFLDAGGASAPSSADTNANGSNPAAATDDGGYGSGGGGGTPAAQGATLEISGFQFGAVTVDPGGLVTVANRDGAPHTVTGGAFDSGQVDGGGTASFTAPGDPGSYDFQCQIHPEMSGTLTVN
jgi:plastocyanin